MRRDTHHRPRIRQIEQRLVKRDAIFGWLCRLLRTGLRFDLFGCDSGILSNAFRLSWKAEKDDRNRERRKKRKKMNLVFSTVEDFHSEAVPSLRSVRTGIFIAQRTLITTRSSFRSEMDVAPKGVESKFMGRGSINIALLTELTTGQ